MLIRQIQLGCTRPSGDRCQCSPFISKGPMQCCVPPFQTRHQTRDTSRSYEQDKIAGSLQQPVVFKVPSSANPSELATVNTHRPGVLAVPWIFAWPPAPLGPLLACSIAQHHTESQHLKLVTTNTWQRIANDRGIFAISHCTRFPQGRLNVFSVTALQLRERLTKPGQPSLFSVTFKRVVSWAKPSGWSQHSQSSRVWLIWREAIMPQPGEKTWERVATSAQ